MKSLLCLHGLLSSGKDFDYIKHRFKDEYDFIYIPTMPGHGSRHDKFNAKKTLDYVINEYDFLHKTYNQIDVLGYSLGGVRFLCNHTL